MLRDCFGVISMHSEIAMLMGVLLGGISGRVSITVIYIYEESSLEYQSLLSISVQFITCIWCAPPSV